MITKIITLSIIAFSTTCPSPATDAEVTQTATATSVSATQLSSIVSAMNHIANGGGIQVGSGDNPKR